MPTAGAPKSRSRPSPVAEHRVCDAEPSQRVQRVRPQRESRADLTQLRLTLPDDGVETRPPQGDGRAEARNSCTHDGHSDHRGAPLPTPSSANLFSIVTVSV